MVVKKRIVLLGPIYPFRGGIAQYNGMLKKQLEQSGHQLLMISFKKQYPIWLFPGRSDRDPIERPLPEKVDYLLDPLQVSSWKKSLEAILAWEAELLIIPWWVIFWAPVWYYFAAQVKKKQPQVKLIFICHNLLPHDLKSWQKRVYPTIIRQVLQWGDRFLLHSKADEQILQQILPGVESRVNLLPTFGGTHGGMEEIRVDSPLLAGLPKDRPLLLFCGFVRPYKGLDLLLEAMLAVVAELPIHLLIAGEFWQGKEPFIKQIEQLGIQESVTILDRYIADEELGAAVLAANLLVLPYRQATQSGVVTMAFGYGCPVLCTDVGGLPEAVQDGVTGLIVPAERADLLAEAILRYFQEGLEEGMREAIQENRHLFSWGQLEEKLISDE